MISSHTNPRLSGDLIFLLLHRILASQSNRCVSYVSVLHQHVSGTFTAARNVAAPLQQGGVGVLDPARSSNPVGAVNLKFPAPPSTNERTRDRGSAGRCPLPARTEHFISRVESYLQPPPELLIQMQASTSHNGKPGSRRAVFRSSLL